MYFYPRSPCGERRFAIVNTPILQRNFYPRSPCGERHCYADNYIGTQKFLSTLSLRRATYMYMIKHINHTFLSTLSLRRATVTMDGKMHDIGISIHALHAESDSSQATSTFICIHFYPRSPCGERLSSRCAETAKASFLSTLSLRRATVEKIITFYPPVFLSTLSLRRATTMQIVIIVVDTVISIHALLAESDEPATSRNNKHNVFLSTLSLRRATGITHG